MNRKIKMAVGLGGPSIIMIVVVLCMTTLGSLSLVTANHDWQLTKKTVDFEKAYYKADCEAEEWLAQVDALLSLGEEPKSMVFQTPVTSRQNLVVQIEITGTGYHVLSEKLVPNEYWDYDEYQNQFNDTIAE